MGEGGLPFLVFLCVTCCLPVGLSTPLLRYLLSPSGSSSPCKVEIDMTVSTTKL